MYPTSVPTHSAEIGTSRSTTGSTLTTGAGGGPAARDASPQPASVAAITQIRISAADDVRAMSLFPVRAIRRRGGLGAEPFCARNRKNDEQDEHDDLGDQERRLALPRRQGVQHGDLQECLDDSDEDVQVERGRRADDEDPAPGSREVPAVAGEGRDRQHHERHDADDVRGQQVIDRKAEPGDAGGDRGHQEERRPAPVLAPPEQSGHHDEARADPDEAEHHVHERERREEHQSLAYDCRNCSRSALTWSLRVLHRPCGAPGYTLRRAFGAILTATWAEAPMGTIWSSSPWMNSVGTVSLRRSSV